MEPGKLAPKPIPQVPVYPDRRAYEVEKQLATFPPLVSPARRAS